VRRLPTRQVHLDFHTSSLIPDVGKRFCKAEFQKALREGNINSITIFAKGHHGNCYYPTKVGTVHPTMEEGFDLTGAMADAAHEIGVDAPIYITAGWSVLDASEHPEWCMRDKHGDIIRRNTDPNAQPTDPRPGCSWDNLCMSGEYAEHIYALTREICDRYDRVDGLFYDIVYLEGACYCDNCKKGMLELGLDPENDEDAKKYFVISHLRFMDECTKILREKHSEATIFFNSGGAEIYAPQYHAGQTHYEMEDLPTAWGGYDKMPPRASVMSRYGKDYLGMTGKFHTEWGEFGGYKNPDALKYEALLMAVYGARVSIGDQLPPDGMPDMETYRIIGHAYRALEKIEPWCYPARPTATLGVYLSGDGKSDEGLHKMLLEGHIDFEIVLPGDDLSPYKALILPDSVSLSDAETRRIQAFVAGGGSVLSTYESALGIDCGAKYLGKSAFRQDYLKPSDALRLPFGNAPFFCYESAASFAVTDGEVLAQIYEPYFDRTYQTFCSHRNAPYVREPSAHPAAVQKGNVIRIAHPLCRLYRNYGAQLFREVLLKALSRIYSPRYAVKNLPSQGRTRLTKQEDASRYVFHAAYASPIQRGNTCVLEDMPELHDIEVTIAMDEKAKSVRLVPTGEEIAFTQSDNGVRFVIPALQCHCAVEIAY
jgi:hypothetical protein